MITAAAIAIAAVAALLVLAFATRLNPENRDRGAHLLPLATLLLWTAGCVIEHVHVERDVEPRQPLTNTLTNHVSRFTNPD